MKQGKKRGRGKKNFNLTFHSHWGKSECSVHRALDKTHSLQHTNKEPNKMRYHCYTWHWYSLCVSLPTLANIVYADRHSKELGFGPNVCIELDFLAYTLRVEGRYCKSLRRNKHKLQKVLKKQNTRSCDLLYSIQSLKCVQITVHNCSQFTEYRIDYPSS